MPRVIGRYGKERPAARYAPVLTTSEESGRIERVNNFVIYPLAANFKENLLVECDRTFKTIEPGKVVWLLFDDKGRYLTPAHPSSIRLGGKVAVRFEVVEVMRSTRVVELNAENGKRLDVPMEVVFRYESDLPERVIKRMPSDPYASISLSPRSNDEIVEEMRQLARSEYSLYEIRTASMARQQALTELVEQQARVIGEQFVDGLSASIFGNESRRMLRDAEEAIQREAREPRVDRPYRGERRAEHPGDIRSVRQAMRGGWSPRGRGR